MTNVASFMLLASLLMLTGCVTETSGGFNVQVSREQALNDYLALARGYLDQGELVSAKRHLNNATEIDRNNAEVFAIWGLVYAREGEVDLADASFRRSLRLDSKNSQARNNYAAFLFANARFEDAFRQLQTVVADTEYPARSQAFENLGFAALRLNRIDDAEAAFTRAVQLNANQVRSILELAGVNLIQQNYQQAGLYYRNYLTVLQFYNQAQSARSLWIGIQLALVEGNETERRGYAAQLEASHRASPEYALYQQLVENPEND
jgi:type IV pilus assembly protein PilF